VLAVETKWTSHALDLGAKRLPPEVKKAMQQAQSNAGRVKGLLGRVKTGTDVIPVVVFWGPNVTPPATPVRREGDVRLIAGGHGSEWCSLLSLERLDVGDIGRLVSRVRAWRIEQERSTVGVGVASCLHKADLLGKTSLGLTGLMVVLLPLSQAPAPVSGLVDLAFRLGGSALAITLFILPLVVAVAAAPYVWLARQLDPDAAWVPRLLPLGVWIVGLTGLVAATS